MQEDISEPITIYCDNTSVINIPMNIVMYPKTKNISMKYHYLREKVQNKQVRLEYVKSKDKIVCIFTKSLAKDAFEYLRGKLGSFSYPKFTM